jgi:hypothetical protein
MKHYILVLVVIFLLLNVTSCGEKAKAGGSITTQTFLGSQGQSCYAMIDGNGNPFAGACQ